MASKTNGDVRCVGIAPPKVQIICCPHIPIHGRASEGEAEAKNLIGSQDSSARCRLCQGSC